MWGGGGGEGGGSLLPPSLDSDLSRVKVLKDFPEGLAVEIGGKPKAVPCEDGGSVRVSLPVTLACQ